MSGFPTLETKRLVLRELVDGDAPSLFAIHSDVEAMRWFGSDPLQQLSEASVLIGIFAHWRTQVNPGVRWGIECKKSGTLLGTCGLAKWNPQWRNCATGFELARSAWGNGYMREALLAAYAWGFSAMQLHRIDAQVHCDNAPSLRLLSQLGFIVEGRARQAGYWRGEFHDLISLGLLHNELTEHGA